MIVKTPDEKLDDIAVKVSRIQDMLVNRLVNQRKLITAAIAGAKWLMKIKRHDTIERMKRIKLQINNYNYRVLEQAEHLTRLLFELDMIESHGDERIREKRKGIVHSIHKKLHIADGLKQSTTKLKEFYNAYILSMGSTSNSQPNSALKAVEDSLACSQSQEQSGEVFPYQQVEQASKTIDSSVSEAYISSLPLWIPNWEMRDGYDGAIYMIIQLPDVDPKTLKVHLDGEILRVSGVKFPTTQDVAQSPLHQSVDHKPSYGRFALEELFPSHMYDLKSATMRQLPNGVLEIRVPRAVPHASPYTIHSPSPFSSYGMTL